MPRIIKTAEDAYSFILNSKRKDADLTDVHLSLKDLETQLTSLKLNLAMSEEIQHYVKRLGLNSYAVVLKRAEKLNKEGVEVKNLLDSLPNKGKMIFGFKDKIMSKYRVK